MRSKAELSIAERSIAKLHPNKVKQRKAECGREQYCAAKLYPNKVELNIVEPTKVKTGGVEFSKVISKRR